MGLRSETFVFRGAQALRLPLPGLSLTFGLVWNLKNHRKCAHSTTPFATPIDTLIIGSSSELIFVKADTRELNANYKTLSGTFRARPSNSLQSTTASPSPCDIPKRRVACDSIPSNGQRSSGPISSVLLLDGYGCFGFANQRTLFAAMGR